MHLRVEVPKALTPRQRELMAEFAAAEGAAPKAPKPTFLQETIDRIKKVMSAGGAGAGDKESKKG